VTASVPAESNQGAVKRSADQSFPRSAHLLRHADFERVYKQGRRHFSPSMTVFYLRLRSEDRKFPGSAGLRVGFTVGRAFGGAVQRNRLKRRLREAVRLSKPWPNEDVDVVINPKKLALALDFETLLNEVRQAFVTIEKKLVRSVNGDSGSRRPDSGSKN